MPSSGVTSDQWWDDDEFQDRLTVLLVQDHQTLKSCSSLLTPEDFRPQRGAQGGRARYLVAERALEHYEKHHEPLGKLLRADVLEYAARLNLSGIQVNELKEYLKKIATQRPTAASAIVDKVIFFKSAVLKKAGIDELIDTQNAGLLTDEKWQEISARAMAASRGELKAVDYLETLEARISRRNLESRRARAPWTFIDPLDSMIRCVGPGQLGLILAPYKRGKSLMLLWLAAACALQRLNTLYVTLEDTRDLVEDRLDSIATRIPVRNLGTHPQTLRSRFTRFRNMVRAKMDILDGTEGGVTVARIEKAILERRDQGFITNALLVDYDEEITPMHRYKDKRFELDEVYRSLRQLMAKYHMIGWTAAQTVRGTRGMKILSGDTAAEDIGKMKKVTCALSLGKGEWTDDSIYIWVAAHKCDAMNIGCEIVPDLKRMLIYDREATRQSMKEHAVDDDI